MADALSPGSTRTSRVIKASREALYRVFTDPAALAVWLAPDQMTAKVHEFDGRVGGGYQMSLFSFIRAGVLRQNLGAGRPFHGTVRRTYAPNKNCPSDHL